MTEIGAKQGEWAGCPMIHDTLRLVIEPRYPFQKLNGARFEDPKEPSEAAMQLAGELADFSKGRIYEINSWYNRHLQKDILVYHTGDHRAKVALMPANEVDERLAVLLHSMDASNCWPLDAEITAVEKLRELIGPKAYRYYVLTGTFLETSTRSNVTYLFRKLRPTLALSTGTDGMSRVLAALCLHPIGYYQNSWAGVMVPTDCLIAHLLMMRGDERKFWAKANQHDPTNPLFGL